MAENIFVKAFVENFIKTFRRYNDDKFVVTINGLNCFIKIDDDEISSLIHQMALYGIDVKLEGDIETIDGVDVLCKNISCDGFTTSTKFTIQDISTLIVLSSKTEISITCLIILKSIALIICKIKTLYKAIVLDLDDTLWCGTLSEIGIEQIKDNMMSDKGKPFIRFMKFVKGIAEELGVFVAICSRNNIKVVEDAIDKLDNEVFPIKSHIDCIIANDNDKSCNISLIAKELSILPDAIVFVDDNSIIRNEVRKNLPQVFIPEWETHDDLTTMLTMTCCFDRNSLSIKSQKRRHQFKVLQAERSQNSFPQLFIKVYEDSNHSQALELYAKSNQFKLISEQINYDNAQSLFFEIYRYNGENLGICSTLTYTKLDNSACGILNWAISCRYFEIGLEEFIILYLLEHLEFKQIHFACQENVKNSKIQEFINKYYGVAICDSSDSVPIDSDIAINQFYYDGNFKKLLLKLRNNNHQFNVYWINEDSNSRNKLRNNTNLELI